MQREKRIQGGVNKQRIEGKGTRKDVRRTRQIREMNPFVEEDRAENWLEAKMVEAK